MPLNKDLLKERLFDPKAYNTVYVNREDEEKAREEQSEVLVELLCDDKHKADRTNILAFIKQEPKAAELLMNAIGQEGPVNRKKLITAAWEADIDGTSHIDMFVNIVLDDEFTIAMEALTAIENMHGNITQEKVESLLNKVMEVYPTQAETPKGHLLLDLVELLRQWQ